MTEIASGSRRAGSAGMRRVPQDKAVRAAVREAAAVAAADLSPKRPPTRSLLERAGQRVLDRVSLPPEYLGFAMVEVSNAFWRPQFEAVPFSQRLLLLPCCLRDADACRGTMNEDGLTCVSCRECTLRRLKTAAEDLGSRVLIAEGTPSVLAHLLSSSADAVLGVACMESLEKAFSRVADAGVPCVAVPLLRDGCANTKVDTREVLELLGAARSPARIRSRSYAPLFRETARVFTPENLSAILETALPQPAATCATGLLAREWIAAGGKRFRPFVTLGAYAVATCGAEVLAAGADVRGQIPRSVESIAVAIEVLHKASLAHDDIEDDDHFRYGRETLHRSLGVGPAINVGDYLVGLGYRLVAAQAEELGADCVADIIAHLSAAHVELCCGQGDELLWQRDHKPLRPVDVLSIFARKTAPAFETALYAGLRAARVCLEPTFLRRFALYLGEAYQVLNDLDDWQENRGNKVGAGLDALAERPTLLRSFAVEAGAGDRLSELAGCREAVRRLYETLGVFDRAERLVDKLRGRALAVAHHELNDPALRDFFEFIVRTVL